MKDLVILKDKKATTTTLKVAEFFGKRHKDILEIINKLDLPEEFREPNFRPRDYTDIRGKAQPMYEMTRDGYTFLIMKFSGKKADKFKLAYIAAFNKMEQYIRKTEIENVQRVLSDYVSVSQFAEDNNIKKTFWCKTKLGNDCSRLSLKMGIPRQVDSKRAMQYQRSIVEEIYTRMHIAEKEDKRAKGLYTQLKLIKLNSFPKSLTYQL